jgi:SAM-dependent methyltransferase
MQGVKTALVSIDIGGGTKPEPGYINLDVNHGEGEWRRRIQEGIPRPDETVASVRASHVMEHIPAGDERIFVMNEVHRVLIPHGTFEIFVPVVGAYGIVHGGWQAFADPTHVSFWYFPESWLYFCDGNAIKADADYGIKLWSRLANSDAELRGGWEAHVTLRKPG